MLCLPMLQATAVSTSYLVAQQLASSIVEMKRRLHDMHAELNQTPRPANWSEVRPTSATQGPCR